MTATLAAIEQRAAAHDLLLRLQVRELLGLRTLLERRQGRRHG